MCVLKPLWLWTVMLIVPAEEIDWYLRGVFVNVSQQTGAPAVPIPDWELKTDWVKLLRNADKNDSSTCCWSLLNVLKWHVTKSVHSCDLICLVLLCSSETWTTLSPCGSSFSSSYWIPATSSSSAGPMRKGNSNCCRLRRWPGCGEPARTSQIWIMTNSAEHSGTIMTR